MLFLRGTPFIVFNPALQQAGPAPSASRTAPGLIQNMNTMRQLTTLLVLLAGTGVTALGGSNPVSWLTNDREAFEAAHAARRPVLMFFTGSDWCVWSEKMEQEVFSSAEFAQYADRNLILLKLEFPRSYDLPAAQMKHNRSLQREYGISGYPTVVVTDDHGVVLGRLTYHQGGPQQFLGELSKLLE